MRSIAVGSLGGLAAAKRGECDFAPIHLFDDKTETYNTPYLADGLELVPGWRRMQGIVFRKGDARFEGLSAEEAVRAALADPACIMVNRNQGAGTRILIDRLLGGRAARRLLESAALAQRGRGRRGAASRRLGHDHRAGGACVGPGFHSLCRRAL